MRFVLIVSSIILLGFLNSGKPIPAKMKRLLQKHGCSSCHLPYNRLVGPSFLMISKKKYTQAEMALLIQTPNPDNWPGFPPMPGKTDINESDMNEIVNFITSLK